jgi:hypothetical protein
MKRASENFAISRMIICELHELPLKNQKYKRMKIYSSGNIFTFIVLVLFSITIVSCDDLVEDGYRIDYPPSDAAFNIEPIGYEMGAVGDIVSYKITASSANAIKSLVIESNQPGANGSGYDVGSVGYDDPFADHIFGTIKKNVTEFTVKYDYIIPKDINKSKLTFSLVDKQGKVSEEVNIAVVPSIKRYPKKNIVAKDNLFYDAFATIDGIVYPDIKTNYSTSSEENVRVQNKIDIVFYHDINNSRSVICSPAYGPVSLNLSVQNQTKFKKMNNISSEDFLNITAASLYEKTKMDSIAYNGSPNVNGIRVGDIVAFTTDINAIHSLKTGLIKVNGLHPTNVSWYEGTSYVLECDIVTQIDE